MTLLLSSIFIYLFSQAGFHEGQCLCLFQPPDQYRSNESAAGCADKEGDDVHEYCAGLLVDAGVLKRKEDERSLMWHGGAHHVGMDVHDPAEYDGNIRPGYVFCVDVGIYCEEWGIGFRLEDNCHITENGCENLSAATPRSVEDIEAFMGRR